MRSVIDPAQPPRVDVAVHLRGRERAVAEQLLDDAEIGSALEQVRGEGVSQPMWVRQESAQRARVESAASGREEDRVDGAGRQLGPAVLEVAAQPVGGLLAQRD